MKVSKQVFAGSKFFHLLLWLCHRNPHCTESVEKMNPPESVPLQGGNMYYPNTGQPPSVVQHTTVNIHREMPQDHFIWSLCCFLYSNPFCLGLAALITSVKARDRKVMGDIEGARAYGTTARTLNIISTVIFCLSVLITIIRRMLLKVPCALTKFC
uniref:Uncharacterized protein n=1 Tax=Neogobius melanostomus TaxID=47308 RepID=A0A8C6WGV0_9GOBI